MVVFDRNGTEITAGQNVLVHQEDAVRNAVVVKLLDSPTVNAPGFWVDVVGAHGVEGVPSYLLEVVGVRKFYVRVRLADAERTLEWREVEAESLGSAVKVAELMPDVEVCLEASVTPGGVVT